MTRFKDVFLLLTASILLLLCNTPVLATPQLKSNAPQRYVVKPGDTLWGIANRYLAKPWQWRQLWQANPQVKNPDRLYPGSVLMLGTRDGRRYLRMTHGGTVKLSPRLRKTLATDAIPTIPLSHIQPFLIKSQVFPDDRLETAPYVLAFAGDHLLGSKGVKIYVSGLDERVGQKFVIYRKAGTFVNGLNKSILGEDALYVGDATLLHDGEPATLEITSINKGVNLGDRLLPQPEMNFDPYFEPKPPAHDISANIIYLYGGINQVANNQVVVINQGLNENLTAGDVLAVFNKERAVHDPLNKKRVVALPPERIGELMLFRVFDKVSFGLVVRATHPIHIDDVVSNP